MNTFSQACAIYAAAGVTLMLIAGGWVKVRDYFARRAADKEAQLELKLRAKIEQEKAETAH